MKFKTQMQRAMLIVLPVVAAVLAISLLAFLAARGVEINAKASARATAKHIISHMGYPRAWCKQGQCYPTRDECGDDCLPTWEIVR